MHLEAVIPAHLFSEFSPFLPALDSVNWHKPVAIAVSGGGDSMALLATVLYLRERHKLHVPLCALTVDHGLRCGSGMEAEAVAQFCNQHGIDHAVLAWKGQKPQSAVAERARMKRRDLLLAECRRRGMQQLLVAHTMDDVAETLLMRVRRGGMRGHAAIAPETQMSGVTILRPFLTARRGELRNALRRSAVLWFDDPTNDDRTYERPRVRQTLQAMDQGTVSTEAIAAYASLMGRWRAVMGHHIAAIVESGCECVGPDVHLRADALRAAPPRIAIETVRELVRFVGGDSYMIDFSQAGDAVRRIAIEEGAEKAFSSGRCVLHPLKGGLWVISRALRDLPVMPVKAGQSVIWDGRFVVQIEPMEGRAVESNPVVSGSVRSVESSGEPTVMPATLPHSIVFRPRVMDGPVASFDRPVFKALEALLVPKGG